MTDERYGPPDGLEYNAYIGELYSPDEQEVVELVVRYGFRNDRYLDWSLTLNQRLGDRDLLRQRTGPLERRTLEIIDVSDSAIRRQVFNPEDPDEPPKVIRLVDLGVDDHARVDHEYQNQLNRICARWARKHGYAIADFPPNRHNTATLNFMAKDREVEFREGESFGWVRNTVVCIDTDFADMVITDRAYFYFPTSPSTAGVAMPLGTDELMKFIWIGPGHRPTDEEVADAESNDGPIQAQGDATMGMLVESIYAGNWTDNVNELLDGE